MTKYNCRCGCCVFLCDFFFGGGGGEAVGGGWVGCMDTEIIVPTQVYTLVPKYQRMKGSKT